MRTVTKVETILEDGDKELIFSKLPNCPCDKCDLRRGGCCGCPDGEKYEDVLRVYKKHNVLELAQKSNSYYNKYKEVEKLTLEMKKLEKEFEDIHLNIKYIIETMEGSKDEKK